MLSNLADNLQYLVEKGPIKKKKFLFILILLPSVILRLYHVLSYPVSYGYDSSWHMSYILHIASKWSIPSAYANLESYQPPLYYFISACLSAIIGLENHIAVKFCLKLLNSIYGFLMLFFIYKTLTLVSSNYLKNNNLIVLCATALAFYLPAHIYISPIISNEMMCACLITIGLYLLTSCVIKRNFSKTSAYLLGISIGLALLTKYTAFLFFIVFTLVSAILFISDKINRKQILTFFAVALSLILLISGWWYIRNTVKYGNPLIKSNDIQKFSNVYMQQPPGYRSLKDFFLFDFRIFSQPFLALDGQSEKLWRNYKKNHFLLYYNNVFNSVLTGTFSTIWIENHGLFLNTETKCLWLSRFLLIPGFLICILTVIGFLKLTSGLFTEKNQTGLIATVMLVFISLAAYVGYNIKYPYFYHIKAFLMLHLTCPFVLSFCYGLDMLLKKSKILFIFSILVLLITFSLVTALYGLCSF